MAFTGGIRGSSVSPHAEEQNSKRCRLPKGDGNALLRSAEWSYSKIQSQTSACVAGMSCKSYIIQDRLIKGKMRAESSCRKPKANRQWRRANFLCSLESTTVGILLRGDVASQNKHDGKPGGHASVPLPDCFTPNILYYLQLWCHKSGFIPYIGKELDKLLLFGGVGKYKNYSY